MAERDSTGQRTEQPTRRRLEEARRKGIVARSADLTAAVLALAGLAMLAAAAPGLLGGLQRMTTELLAGAGSGRAGLGEALWRAVAPVAGTLGLMCAGLAAVAIGVNVLQVGFLVTAEPLGLDLGRLWPGGRGGGAWLRRSAVRLAMTLAKIAAVGAVVFMTVRAALPRIVAAARLQAGPIAAEAGGLVMAIGVRVGLVLLALAGVDWLYQRFQHRQDLMMTRREVEDELRQDQGSSAARARRGAPRAGGAPVAVDEGEHNG